MTPRWDIPKSCPRALALRAIVAVALLLAAGCTSLQSHIDPSGDSIFLHHGQAAVAPPLVPPARITAPPIVPLFPSAPVIASQPGVTVSPSQVIAPVNSEVVMVASVCGGDGYMVTGERVEWMLPPGEMGQIVGFEKRGFFDFADLFRGLPRKLSNTYVINSTLSSPKILDRGTPTPVDDVPVQAGQSWVTVTSGREGTSHVTAYVPNVPAWDRRQQTATIYWVDAQWTFPPPAINPSGSRHTFTTLVTRRTDGSAAIGYVVRYEIVGGPEAGFGPDGAPAAEVPVNGLGQASVEILQKASTVGSNQIAIQVIRPADNVLNAGKRLIVGSGTTTKTWTSTSIAVRTTGPAVATVGSTVTYRIEVSNPGAAAIPGVVVADEPPAGLSYLNSNPAANASPSGEEWRIGDLGPGESRAMEANFRVDRAGNFNYCASATSAAGMAAKSCATTTVGAAPVVQGPAAPAPLVPAPVAQVIGVKVTGPEAATVGDTVKFVVTITNNGQTAAAGLTISDRFDPGLQHTTAPGTSIDRPLLDSLAPGEQKSIGVSFRVIRPGQLCQTIEIRGAAGVLATAHPCLTAVAVAAAPAPQPAAPPELAPDQPRPVHPEAPPTPAPRLQESRKTSFSVTMTGPDRLKVQDVAEFKITITNTGSAPLTNVKIADNYDPSLEPTEATSGLLQWTVKSLAPGRSIHRQVNCKCLQATARACNRVTVSADDVDKQAAEACVTVVEAAPAANGRAADQPAAPQLSLSVADEVDPVKVGGETNYQIVLTNKGPGSAKDVVVSTNIPKEMLPVLVKGQVHAAQVLPDGVRFEPVAELRAGETLTFEVRVRAKTPGTAKFHVEVTSQGQRQPVTADETTEVLEK